MTLTLAYLSGTHSSPEPVRVPQGITGFWQIPWVPWDALGCPGTPTVSQQGTREAEVLKGLAELEKNGPKRLANGLPDWSEEDGLVFHKGRIYVPSDLELRQAVLKQCHDDPTAGHPGEHGTYELLSRSFWWPQARAFVKVLSLGWAR
ncbi:hypothetical protein NMY22_g14343 [Coprinellus aureogranulatus]|nr:hypothetical protein NMY22_g14343 [Coprinellus aureogranulatus]